MKKILLLLLSVFALGANAEVVDVLNQALTGISSTGYQDFSNKTSNSAAVYAGQCAGSYESIQLRSKNSNSGIVTTTSGGKVKHIKVTWEGNTTTGRTLEVYGSHKSYTDATDLYDGKKQGDLLGSIVCGTSTELNVDGDYEFVGFRSNNNAMYLSSIEITWENNTPSGDPVSVESVTLTNDKGEALGMYQALTVTETMKIIAQVSPSDATNKTVSWEVIQDDEVISFENGVVKALAPGRAALVATTEDGEYQAAVTFVVSPIQDATIADFIAAKGKTCYLTGVVGKIKNTTYGNFNLTDESGTISVYGCLTPDGEKQKFAELGVEEGNKITVLASSYQLYKEETDEAVDVVFVENHGTPAAPKTYTFEVKAGEKTFTITPSDDEVLYYVEALPAGYDAEAITSYFDSNFEDMGAGLEYFNGVSTQSYEDDWYLDEPGSYVIALCAVDENYKRVSDVTIVPFTAAVMSVSEAGYATFVAPFQVTVPEAVKAYTVDAVDGTALTLTEVSPIAANTPVVLAGALDETIVYGKGDKGYIPVAGLLTGVYKDTPAPVDSYVLQNHASGVGFYKVGSVQPKVEPNHAYLTVDSDVKVFGLAQTTAIKALTAGKAEIYDVNGRQIQKLQKGINIVNGVKVLVK